MKENGKLDDQFSLSSQDMVIAWCRAELAVLLECTSLDELRLRFKLLDCSLEGVDVLYNSKLRLIELQADLIRSHEERIAKLSRLLAIQDELLTLHKETAHSKEKIISGLRSRRDQGRHSP